MDSTSRVIVYPAASDSPATVTAGTFINDSGGQPALVSGTNIKTINGASVLGSGDLSVSGSAAWGGITGTLSSQTDLQSALDAKQATLVSATNIKTINGSSVLGSGDLVVSGSDPWTYVTLGSDFTISTTANNNVTGLSFAPAASTRYLIEGYYLLRTATITTGARPGIAWPTGYDDGASYTQAPNSATANAIQNGAPATGTANAASTGLPVINRSYLGLMNAMLLMGGSPSGNFQITLASETAAVNVTMRAGSFIRYRTY